MGVRPCEACLSPVIEKSLPSLEPRIQLRVLSEEGLSAIPTRGSSNLGTSDLPPAAGPGAAPVNLMLRQRASEELRGFGRGSLGLGFRAVG